MTHVAEMERQVVQIQRKLEAVLAENADLHRQRQQLVASGVAQEVMLVFLVLDLSVELRPWSRFSLLLFASLSTSSSSFVLSLSHVFLSPLFVSFCDLLSFVYLYSCFSLVLSFSRSLVHHSESFSIFVFFGCSTHCHCRRRGIIVNRMFVLRFSHAILLPI